VKLVLRYEERYECCIPVGVNKDKQCRLVLLEMHKSVWTPEHF